LLNVKGSTAWLSTRNDEVGIIIPIFSKKAIKYGRVRPYWRDNEKKGLGDDPMANSEKPTQLSLWKTILLWNAVVMLAFVVGLGYAYVLWPLGGPARITELDRAGVINEAKLRESFPDLAVNLRHDLGMCVAEIEREGAQFVVWMGIAAAVINVLLALSLRPRKQQPADRQADIPKPHA
jgi:hypothetical protein